MEIFCTSTFDNCGDAKLVVDYAGICLDLKVMLHFLPWDSSPLGDNMNMPLDGKKTWKTEGFTPQNMGKKNPKK